MGHQDYFLALLPGSIALFISSPESDIVRCNLFIMGKPRDEKVRILPSTTRRGTTLSTQKDDFERAHRVALQHLQLIEIWVEQHKCLLEQEFIKLGRPRKKADVTRAHNSTFTRWFKQKQLELAKKKTPSTEDEKLIFSLSRGPTHNVRTYQAYDINGYRFYTARP